MTCTKAPTRLPRKYMGPKTLCPTSGWTHPCYRPFTVPCKASSLSLIAWKQSMWTSPTLPLSFPSPNLLWTGSWFPWPMHPTSQCSLLILKQLSLFFGKLLPPSFKVWNHLHPSSLSFPCSFAISHSGFGFPRNGHILRGLSGLSDVPHTECWLFFHFHSHFSRPSTSVLLLRLTCLSLTLLP